jgi:hypothetical protein
MNGAETGDTAGGPNSPARARQEESQIKGKIVHFGWFSNPFGGISPRLLDILI